MTEPYDILILGGGPGGYVAAIRAAQLGFRVGLVEREHLGGICLNWGCIPTKALLRSSEIYQLMQHASDFGLSVSGASFDLEKIVGRSRKVAAQLSSGIRHLMKKNKITVHEAHARLLGAGKIEIEAAGKKETLSAKHIIIATGARARTLPHLQPNGQNIWTYKDAMTPKVMPKKLLVIGSGAIGIEFASFYRALGAEVMVVEMLDRILPNEDAEISKLAQKSFEKQGMRFATSCSLEKIEAAEGGLNAHLKHADGKLVQEAFTHAIIAIGIIGNTENIGLENTKVKVEKGHIVTDAWSLTGELGVYAIGDVTGGPWLAHKASHEGIICIEKIKGLANLHPMDKSQIPGCTYSHPQIASVGYTEEKAAAAGFEIKVGRFPLIGNGKAIALGDTDCLIKTIIDAKTGALLGAHLMGPEVTEMIQGYAIARTLESTEAELMHTIFPHPTLSEAMHESVLDAFGRVIHF